MEPGGCKQFLGRADQKDNFQLLATFFFFFPCYWYFNCKEFFEECGANQKSETTRWMEMGKNNKAGESRNSNYKGKHMDFREKKNYNYILRVLLMPYEEKG